MQATKMRLSLPWLTHFGHFGLFGDPAPSTVLWVTPRESCPGLAPKTAPQTYHEVSTPLRRKNDLKCSSSFQACLICLPVRNPADKIQTDSNASVAVRRGRRRGGEIKKVEQTSTFGLPLLYIHLSSPRYSAARPLVAI